MPFMYQCEDLISNATTCSLTVTNGTVQVRNLTLMYWEYVSERPQVQTQNGSTPANETIPLIFIAGGPGANHQYLQILRLIACSGTPLILYDQIGTGMDTSSRPENISQDAPWLYTVDYYVEELETLIAALNMSKVHVAGHSWGGIVALEYAIKQPVALRSLILSNTFADTQFVMRELLHLWQAELPSFIYNRLIGYVTAAEQPQTSVEYWALLSYIYGQYISRTFPIPDCLWNVFHSWNLDVMTALKGRNEIFISGALSNYSLSTAQLQNISVPTLVIRGEYDPVTEAVARNLTSMISNAMYVEIPAAGHISMIDAPLYYVNVTEEFLTSLPTLGRRP